MSANDALCDGVRILLNEATKFLRVRGLGVVREDGPDHVTFTYVDAFGATAYRTRLDGAPAGLRPRNATRELAEVPLDAGHAGLIETRLLHTGFAESTFWWNPQEQGRGQQVVPPELDVLRTVVQLVPDLDEPMTFLVALGDDAALTADHISGIERLARRVVEFVHRTPSLQEERNLSRRLEAVAKILPTLFRVLDVREIFDRISTIAKEVLRHDFATIGLFVDDLTTLQVYVQTSGGPYEVRSGPMPFPVVQTGDWLYRFVDDLTANPMERDSESVRGGGRSSIRVAIRLEDTILGALNFTSRDRAPYTATDLAVCRRIAEYVALALSHQRLAEEARLNEELRARAANLELVDELLATLSDSGDFHEVLARISPLARKVLPHDDLIEVPAPSASDREFDLIDDVNAVSTPVSREMSSRGFRSALQVPVRLDGRVVTVVAFVSRASANFKQQDVVIARRIADRIALSVSHERGQEAARRADEATARAARLESRVRALTDELDARTGVRRIVGESARWRQALTQATQVAATETTVLLLGESGSGKEVLARFLHRASPRSNGPFIALNCAALPEQLLEAELFGYERGAYTGATQSKPGQLELAAGGTLFLDEVGEMSPSAQAKFLRVLQEREFQRLGGTRVLRSDARIVAATNRDLPRNRQRPVPRGPLLSAERVCDSAAVPARPPRRHPPARRSVSRGDRPRPRPAAGRCVARGSQGAHGIRLARERPRAPQHS
jgi:transcriptional regulator with GAF, ATPase, and Fis domain